MDLIKIRNKVLKYRPKKKEIGKYDEYIIENKQRFDIQLKGSGRTPYSRGGDGKATLKAMLREYLISEAMYHLNIPSSRSLTVIKTGEQIHRQSVNEGLFLQDL